MILFDSTVFTSYCLAAGALVIAPGPGQTLVIARAVEGGTRAGVLTAIGLEVGTLARRGYASKRSASLAPSLSLRSSSSTGNGSANQVRGLPGAPSSRESMTITIGSK